MDDLARCNRQSGRFAERRIAFFAIGAPITLIGAPFITIGGPIIPIGGSFVPIGDPFVPIGDPFVPIGASVNRKKYSSNYREYPIAIEKSTINRQLITVNTVHPSAEVA